MSASAVEQVCDWLDEAVIGLKLCPFAAAPRRAGLVRVTGSQASDDESLLTDLEVELRRLDAAGPEGLETTLLVVERMLADFEEFNQFLDLVDGLLHDTGREGVYQVASFHPQYQFADTEPDDPGNLTNRSPWPVLHVIREASIDAALAREEDTSSISERNIETMRNLSDAKRRRLFHDR
ncbi:MAG: DUF1415 domain-containing protein [Pseudomonadota bacterium]